MTYKRLPDGYESKDGAIRLIREKIQERSYRNSSRANYVSKTNWRVIVDGKFIRDCETLSDAKYWGEREWAKN